MRIALNVVRVYEVSVECISHIICKQYTSGKQQFHTSNVTSTILVQEVLYIIDFMQFFTIKHFPLSLSAGRMTGYVSGRTFSPCSSGIQNLINRG